MTAQEAQLAELTAAGLQDREIAVELGVSVRAVKACKRRVARRLGYNGKRLDILLVRAVCGGVPSPHRLEIFRPRVRRAAELAAEGLTNPEIAASLGISPDSVRTYMKEIFDQAGVWNRRELARFVLAGDGPSFNGPTSVHRP